MQVTVSSMAEFRTGRQLSGEFAASTRLPSGPRVFGNTKPLSHLTKRSRLHKQGNGGGWILGQKLLGSMAITPRMHDFYNANQLPKQSTTCLRLELQLLNHQIAW